MESKIHNEHYNKTKYLHFNAIWNNVDLTQRFGVLEDRIFSQLVTKPSTCFRTCTFTVVFKISRHWCYPESDDHIHIPHAACLSDHFSGIGLFMCHSSVQVFRIKYCTHFFSLLYIKHAKLSSSSLDLSLLYYLVTIANYNLITQLSPLSFTLSLAVQTLSLGTLSLNIY